MRAPAASARCQSLHRSGIASSHYRYRSLKTQSTKTLCLQVLSPACHLFSAARACSLLLKASKSRAICTNTENGKGQEPFFGKLYTNTHLYCAGRLPIHRMFYVNRCSTYAVYLLFNYEYFIPHRFVERLGILHYQCY